MQWLNKTHVTKSQRPYESVGGRVTSLHVVVIGLSLLMTIGAYHFSKQQIDTRTEARFELAADQAIALLENRMQKYEDALWAGVAFIDAQGGDIGKEEWRIFAESLRLPEKYPGINGIGVVHFVTEAALQQYLAARKSEAPGFDVYPAHDQSLRMPISFIEPQALNAAAVGLDVAHERNRQTAALKSRDTASAQITGPIVLVQDESSTPGFLFYAPFYEGGMPANAADREQRALGAVYAPFVVHNLMEGLLAKELRDVRFSIRDGGELIYDEHSQSDPLADPTPMYRDTRSIELHGRQWELDIASNLAFRASNSYAQPNVILFGGLLIEALIIAILVMMSRANIKATRYAKELTFELRSEKEKLAKTNRELEQCVYLMSHDLKTPLRGIGGLADMIRDDLQDYFMSPKADPKVSENLQRIEERVGRLNDLSNGVLEWAAIDQAGFEAEPVSLIRTVQAMRRDLDLDRDALNLSSELDYIHVDAPNFVRVLQNLVSNAKLHHDNPSHIRINISIRVEDGRCVVAVSDNGPGIEERHHNRIFDVFQTLGLPNSTPGSGLGLAIVKKTVEGHRGSVKLTSTQGEGSCFVFDWPLPEAVANRKQAA